MAGRIGIDSPATASPDPPELVSDELPILAVDDRQENLVALQAVLEPLGLPIVTATSGEEALRLLLARDFSLILLDVWMPGIDGLETARMIKSREHTREIPIVFLTAARDDLGDVVRGYGVGAVDYVVKPFDPDVLRSKVAVFAQLEQSRRQLRRSQALLQGAFEAAPVGKTVLDTQGRIIRSNPAFARMVGAMPEELVGRSILELCHADDGEALSAVLARVGTSRYRGAPDDYRLEPDLRLLSGGTTPVWVAPAASAIETTQLEADLLLFQWVDVTARRRAEEARAELLIEQAARESAEAQADRLEKLRRLVEPVDAAGLNGLLRELARRLTDAFEADAAEVEIEHEAETGDATRSTGAHVEGPGAAADPRESCWEEMPLLVEGEPLGRLRLLANDGHPLRPLQRELLRDAADRISLMIRAAQLHEQERRIALELQRGLLPARPPEIDGVAIVARFEAAGLGAEIGGDWYDCFLLPDGRLGVVIGDVTGNGIRAASAMGQLRSVARAFALDEADSPSPAEVIARLHRYHRMSGLEELLTAIYLTLDPETGRLVWANAGHPPPLLRAGDGTVRRLAGADSMICGIEAAYRDREVNLEEGDTLVLYTDGLIERRGESLDAGIERLAQTLRLGPQEPEELCRQVLVGADQRQLPPQDDVTALVMKLVGGRSKSAGPGAGAPGEPIQLTLAPAASVPNSARRMLEDAFGDELDPAELERARLALSELATNAVCHGNGAITLIAQLDADRLLVEVIDEGSGFDYVARRPEPGQLGGWGLAVVDATTSRWGIREGKSHVWFEVERGGPSSRSRTLSSNMDSVNGFSTSVTPGSRVP